MKQLNKKGFTLIELLAVIIILGVLLLIAVPSVSKYITNSRMDTYETNLKKLVDAVSAEVNSYSKNYSFKSSEYLIVPLVCIEIENGSNKESPFGPYIPINSFVAVTRKYETGTNVPKGFNYYVSALDVNGFGTSLTDPYSDSFQVVGNPRLTAIEEVVPNTDPKSYKLTGEVPSYFATEIINRTGNLVTCDEYVSNDNNTSMYGDINGDGIINNKDFGILRQYLNGLVVSIVSQNADLNSDGMIDDIDLLGLRRYLNDFDVTFPFNSGATYNITYNLVGGEVDNNRHNVKKYAEMFLPITLTAPQKEGYVFLGWTGSNGNTPELEVTIDQGTTGNLSYTANWALE